MHVVASCRSSGPRPRDARGCIGAGRSVRCGRVGDVVLVCRGAGPRRTVLRCVGVITIGRTGTLGHGKVVPTSARSSVDVASTPCSVSVVSRPWPMSPRRRSADWSAASCARSASSRWVASSGCSAGSCPRTRSRRPWERRRTGVEQGSIAGARRTPVHSSCSPAPARTALPDATTCITADGCSPGGPAPYPAIAPRSWNEPNPRCPTNRPSRTTQDPRTSTSRTAPCTASPSYGV